MVAYLDIYSNIELPMMASDLSKKERSLRVDSLIEFLNLNSISSRLPENISGGEQQVSAIAVALANQPPLLLADEPTGALDDETSPMVLAKMRDVNENYGTTFVIVTHDPKIEDHVNRSIGMRDGKTHVENIEVDKKILEAGHHHGSTYYEHLAFLKAIENNSDPEVSLEDGLIAVAVGEAAEQSIKQGRLINLEEIIN